MNDGAGVEARVRLGLGRRAARCVSRWALPLALALRLAAGGAVHGEESGVSAALVNLYQSGRLPAARQGAVVEMICRRGNAHDLRVVYDRLLAPDGMERPLRASTLDWLYDAAVTRKVRPAGDLGGVATLLESPDAALRTSAVRLAAVWGVAEVAPALENVARDPAAPGSMRRMAIEGLVALRAQQSEPLLVELASASTDDATRILAVSALARVNLPRAARLAADVMTQSAADQDLGPLLDALCDRRDGSDLLAEALRARRPDADTAKRMIRHMLAVGRSDANLSAVLSEAAGVSAEPWIPTPLEVATLAREALELGDAARGERVFRRADVSCFRCHALHGAGGQVGPDLTALGGSSPIDYVVNSILNPNAAVKEQFVTRLFETADGRILTGIVIDRDDARVRIRDAKGETMILPTADIDLEAEGRSIMPEGMTKLLTRAELLDLIRFVSELGKPGTYGPRTSVILQRWQRLAQPAAELVDQVPHLEHLREHVDRAPPEAWAPLYALCSGVVPLDELRRDGAPLVVILRGALQVHEPGVLGVDVASTEICQVWVGGHAVRPGETAHVPLEPGRHQVTARVEISSAPEPGLKVEFLRPAGSPIQFELVGGF